MSTLGLVVAELRHRPGTAFVTLVMMVLATAVVVFFVGVSDLAATRTRLIQRDLGLNVRLIPETTDLNQYWLRGYSTGTIDEAIVSKLEAQDVANRLVPMLQRTIPWGESEAILTGIGKERFKRGQSKKPVFGGPAQSSDELVLGSTAAQERGLAEGDKVSVLGRDFTVKRILAESGSIEDIRVHAGLEVVQELLEMPGKLNEIRALECHCDASIADPTAYLRETLEPLLPGTRVIRQDRMADARRQQRLMAERTGAVAAPLLAAFATIGVMGLTLLNANQRRVEIGMLAALGRTPGSIALMIGARSVLLGLLGGLIGGCLGWVLINQYGSWFLGPGPGKFELELTGVLISGVLGGAIASLGALIPAALAARVDPAETLRGLA